MMGQFIEKHLFSNTDNDRNGVNHINHIKSPAGKIQYQL